MDPGNGSADVPDDLVKRLQNADVTTIVDDVKAFASGMFDRMAPSITHDIGEGIDKGINGVGEALSAVDNQRADLEQALETLGSAAFPAMSAGAEALQGAHDELSTLRDQMQGMEDSVPAAHRRARRRHRGRVPEDAERRVPRPVPARGRLLRRGPGAPRVLPQRGREGVRARGRPHPRTV